jgi:hypothetical protein
MNLEPSKKNHRSRRFSKLDNFLKMRTFPKIRIIPKLGKTSIFGNLLPKLEFKAKMPLQKKIHISKPNLQKLTKIKKNVHFEKKSLESRYFVVYL